MIGKVKKHKQKLLLALLVVTAIIANPITNTVYAAGNSAYSDVPTDHWAYEYITNLSNNGIVNGFADGTYHPNDSLTRGQAAKMIAEAINLNCEGKIAKFSDVANDHEYSKYIAGLTDINAIRGYPDGTYRMHDNISRQQIAQIIVEAFKLDRGGVNVPRFTDLPSGEAGEYIEILASNGIIKGYDGPKYKPNNNILRAQFAKILVLSMEDGEAKKEEVLKIAIMVDPGHGGNDSGAVNHNLSLEEADLNLAISLKVRDKLEAEGYEVVMTRTTDETLVLGDRSDQANALGTDIFVSIHCNATGPGLAPQIIDGIETLYYPTSTLGKKLATHIQERLIEYTAANDRGIKGRSDLSVLRRTTMPAVLIECGFVSNNEEGSKLNDPSYQNILANAIVVGINDYFGR